MALDIVAFSLAALLLTVVVAILAVGFTDLTDPPPSTWCHQCARWMVNKHHQAEPLCLRCRLTAGFDSAVHGRR
ncbi:hypothetical protein AB0L82_15110 [Nocardia sp. NPDC052001]|uniref:hypothetical protein n=1 Tax=Nocardia sp. NPDC052001 TaxID=3154853 RepID=UPI003417D47B